MTPDDYAELLPHASPRQVEMVRALKKEGSFSKASVALGITKTNFTKGMQRLRKAAARKDPASHIETAPDGYHLRGVSTMTDADGNVKLQWRKTAVDGIDPDAFAEKVAESLENLHIRPRQATKAPAYCAADTLNVLPIGDPHFGMLAWRPECGDSWDLHIASEVHAAAFERLLTKAPKAAECLLVWMGDNAHADNSSNETPTSKHTLDVDSRWTHMLDVLSAAMVNSVELALRRHETVRLRIVLGNHDPHVSAGLALAVQMYYRNEPRVTVERQPTPLYVETWGRVMLVFGHGHAPRPDKIPGILAADYREEMGRTEQTYCYTGHVHNKMLGEVGGIVFEVVQTLAAKDGYATHGGWRSARGLLIDTYRRDCLVATDRGMVAAQDAKALP